MSLSHTLKEQQREIERFLRLTKGWTAERIAIVVIGWLGTTRAKQMNDFLERP